MAHPKLWGTTDTRNGLPTTTRESPDFSHGECQASWEGLYKVIWDEENLMYMIEDAYGDREKLCEFEEYLKKGNIYENPELLERCI